MMSRPSDTDEQRAGVPEVESPDARTEEQEVAAGRTAATPFLALGSVGLVIACAVVVVVALVVLAMYLA